MNNKFLLRAVSLLILLALLTPVHQAGALAVPQLPPVDMFQLPWDQGLAWFAVDGFDNGSKRPASSSHNYKLGGAIDFAPRNTMFTGEDTSNFWVTAAAAGIVVETSNCHLGIAHDGGWITQYLFLGNIQVNLGDTVTRNQRLGVIADGIRYRYCTGYLEPNTPHLHFMLRPTMVGATFAGWQFNYNSLFNRTTFTKGLITVGLFKPLLNVPIEQPTATPTVTQSATATLVSETPSASATSSPTQVVSPTPTLFGPYVSTLINPQAVNVGETALVTVSLNNVPAEGYTSAEFTCTYNANLFEVSNITIANLFGADPATAINGPQAQSLIVAIAGSNGNKATTSGPAFTFNVTGSQVGQTVIECRARVSQGNNVLTEIPFAVDYITILGSTPTPNLTPSHTPTATQSPEPFTPTATETSSPGFPTPTSASQTPTPTIPMDWLTYTNSFYGFQFRYPPRLEDLPSQDNNYARIDLPFVQGTNLSEKYLEVIVVENANPCQSPLQTPNPGETVTINGISFLKQTGADAGVGHLHQWIAYSTLRDNVCVSLDFILHSLNPGNSATPPPVFDFVAESAVFAQIVETYTWLTLAPTATFTPTVTLPAESPTATQTSAPVESSTPTATQISGAVLTGQVIASKVVAVRLYDPDENFVAAVNANPDGTFSFDVAAGTYTVVATANGFLRIQGTVTLADGENHAMPMIALLAGDIDDDNAIDQFDAMTIGFNYGGDSPPGADLNSDGVINVMDLELLAQNYRETGPVVWE